VRLINGSKIGPLLRGPIFIVGWLSSLLFSSLTFAAGTDWLSAVKTGDYDLAVKNARAEPESDLSKALIRADELLLHESSMWRALIHYQSTFSGVESQVDSPWFFQSTNGKTDAKAELDATLAALYRTDAKEPMRLSPYCRFVARRFWLAEQLGDVFSLIPAQPCPESDQFTSYLNAHTLTLVFPTSHPNSPASAFGHTLIRVDQEGQTADAKLLNMSINFAAEVPPSVSPFTYLVGGLGGGFPGKFRLLPYHQKLREYRQINNRDTWEYPLKLNQDQVDLVLRHAYEMLIAEFDYFFFSENCSYHLLGLLDVAFADDPLANHFSLWTIPVDTIKLLDERDLLATEQFVPSTIRTLREREAGLNAEEQRIALDATNKGLDSVSEALDALSDERAALVLDTIGDYNRYSRLKQDNSPSGLSETERGVLSRRSKLGVRTEAPVVAAPDFAPQLGHETARLSFSLRALEDDESEFELNYRAAYHDPRDPSTAYGTRAAIEFLSVSIARDSVDEAAYLKEFTAFSIDSIEPRSQFFKPISWRTSVSWTRPSAGGDHEGDALDDPSLPKRVSVQVGSRLGVHWEPVRKYRLGVEWEHRELLGERRYDSQVEVWASLSPSRNSAIVIEANERQVSDQEPVQTVAAELRLYF